METIKKYWWVVVLFLAILLVGNKLPKIDILPSVTTHINTNGPAEVHVTTHDVSVKPAPSKDNPKPVATHTWKPAESNPTITTKPDGKVEVKIPRFGLCFVPKVGAEIHTGSKINWAIGARLIFWNRLGIAPMFNDRGISPQVDFRVGNLGAGIGPWFGWLGSTGISGSLAVYVL